ncbi:MAG: DNA translocase FtsK 4TM domain-containing protein, partial [Anaerolineales bacterium]|nr:DNA translocase FtsK 4TM domain-containing protein [Anaerolineales bacterium]
MARKKSTKANSNKNNNSADSPQPPPTLDEQLIDALRPWLVEIGGGALALFSFILILSFLGFTNSNFLGIFTDWLTYFFGWGAYVLVLLLIGTGIHIATRRVADKRPYDISTRQVVGIEFLILTALPLSHLFSGTDLARAQLGFGGGLIGWALSEPLIDFFGRLPAYAFYFLLLLMGLAFTFSITLKDLIRWFDNASKRLQRWAQKVSPTAVEGAARPLRPVIGGREALPLSASGHTRTLSDTRDSRLPPYDLLEQAQTVTVDRAEINRKKQIIEKTLLDFGLPATVVSELIGPAITQFGVEPGHIERPGPDGEMQKYKVRVGQIARLNKDLALALAAARVRIEAPVPGKGIVGVEVPNSEISTVRLGTLVASETFKRKGGTLGIALGEDVSGAPVVADVTRLPHMLVAGQTGSGKSVFINSLIACLVFNNTPEHLQLIMIDPKKVELIRFNGLPHLLGKVEVEGERAIGVLRWLTAEMDERYRKFAEVGARNLEAYN